VFAPRLRGDGLEPLAWAKALVLALSPPTSLILPSKLAQLRSPRPSPGRTIHTRPLPARHARNAHPPAAFRPSCHSHWPAQTGKGQRRHLRFAAVISPGTLFIGLPGGPGRWRQLLAARPWTAGAVARGDRGGSGAAAAAPQPATSSAGAGRSHCPLARTAGGRVLANPARRLA